MLPLSKLYLPCWANTRAPQSFVIHHLIVKERKETCLASYRLHPHICSSYGTNYWVPDTARYCSTVLSTCIIFFIPQKNSILHLIRTPISKMSNTRLVRIKTYTRSNTDELQGCLFKAYLWNSLDTPGKIKGKIY